MLPSKEVYFKTDFSDFWKYKTKQRSLWLAVKIIKVTLLTLLIWMLQ